MNGLPITGVSVVVGTRIDRQSVVATSGPVAAQLDALQFQLGEGATPEVLQWTLPVLIADLASPAVHRRWPVFVPEAERLGVAALFTFPMLLGPIPVGVVQLSAATPSDPWPDALQLTARRLVDGAARPALELAVHLAGQETDVPGGIGELRREVHQAAGMLTVQLSCSIDEAVTRLRAHSFAQNRPLDEVARLVIERRLRFADLDR